MAENIAQTPLILRVVRLMDAFAKSDDERDFYLNKTEGYILFVDLDKSQEELDKLYVELSAHPESYFLMPKLTFYETKKIMEGFVHEKVYDIDTKEKLLDIIQSKEAREHFLEFIYDHETELEKWHQYYQERSRVRIIEWLRSHNFQFVFEEDIDLPKQTIEQLKLHLFDPKVSKELQTARQTVIAKAKSYYSNEALNPRPKRGRPPKQVTKIEIETEVSGDIYTTVPQAIRRFLHLPEISNPSSITFSEKFDTEEEFLAHLRRPSRPQQKELESLAEKLAHLRQLSTRLKSMQVSDENIFKEEEDEDEEDEIAFPPKKPLPKKKKEV